MADEYTPTTDEFRRHLRSMSHLVGRTPDQDEAMFDRMLAAHDREVRQGMLPDGARFFPDEAGIVFQGKVYFPGDYVLTRLDIASVRAAALRDAAAVFTWAGDDEDYTAFRDWLMDRADRIQEGDV